jgi:hypothetical protein
LGLDRVPDVPQLSLFKKEPTMAAFVVVTQPEATGASRVGRRLGIFPGSATPTVFPADVPFWVGYGFVPDPAQPDREPSELDTDTRFELDVDGGPVAVEEEMVIERGQVVSKRCVAHFASGLPAGWHRFAGRWYDAGSLVLTSDRSIQFVER